MQSLTKIAYLMDREGEVEVGLGAIEPEILAEAVVLAEKIIAGIAIKVEALNGMTSSSRAPSRC
jgi:hypothetical protein